MKKLVCMCLLLAGIVMSAAAQQVAVNPAGTFPITKEKIVFRVVMEDQGAPDYTTNWFTKYLEQKTNIQVKWELLPYDKSMERANLIIASGDLPDIFIAVRFAKEDVFKYAKEGVFVPIERWIDLYGVNQKDMYTATPWLAKSQVFPDGHKYSLEAAPLPGHMDYWGKMWINQDWLTKLKLAIPKTTADFAQVLRAFKTGDPNQNGKRDEIPLTGATRIQERPHFFLMNAFVYNDARTYLFMKDGKVQFAANTPEWRKGLEYMNGLYKEGLIDPAAFTQERKQAGLLFNGDTVLSGAFVSHHPGNIISSAQPVHKQVVAVPPLKGPDGVQWAGYNDQRNLGTVTGGFFVVTKACKNPDAAVRWGDYLLSGEAAVLTLYGPEGKHWRKAAAGELNLAGTQATFKILDDTAVKDNDAWGSGFLSWLRASDVVDRSDPWDLSIRLHNETEKYRPFGPSMSMVYPGGLIFVDADKVTEKAQLSTVINDYVLESTTRFIMGDRSLATDWDKYVKELGNMGLPRYLDILQKAYDASSK